MTSRHMQHLGRPSVLTAILMIGLVAAGTDATAQTSDAANAAASTSRKPDQPPEEVIVQATRSRIPLNLSTVPGSVTVIGAAELEKQTRFTTDLGEILQRGVPGLGVNSGGTYQNFNQTLRGRKPLVFIDGAPASVALRDGGHDFRLINPAVVGRVEVISGATALYGLGAGGGIINYATKEPVEGQSDFATELGMGSSITHPGDSLSYSINQSASAKVNRFSYVLSGFYETHNSLFGAGGDRIPPDPQNQGGIADTNTYNLYGKVGFDLTDEQRVFASINSYRTAQDTDYTAGAGVFGTTAAPAIKGSPGPNAKDQFTKNLLATLRYAHDDILGSQLSVQAYYSNYKSRFAFSAPPLFPPAGAQSNILSDRSGLRVDVTTPFTVSTGTGNLLWGADYAREKPVQQLEDGRWWVPPLDVTSVAPFVQFDYPLLRRLTLRGGLRYDSSSIDVPTFSTVTVTAAQPLGNTVQGGSLSYSKLIANLGAVTAPIASGPLHGISFYAGFSQGYAIGDLGRALRATSAPSVESFSFAVDTIDNYEIGARADYGDVKAQAAVYYVESEFGGTFNPLTFELLRAPERLWGVELQVDAHIGDTWNWGASFSNGRGETENIATGVWSNLDTSRIAPPKLSTYIEHVLSPNWSIRAQLLHSGRESRFPNNPVVFGRHDIEGYSLVDASLSGRIGPGSLTIAVNNLLNERYFTPDAWRYAGNNTFTSGEGATMRATYTIHY